MVGALLSETDLGLSEESIEAIVEQVLFTCAYISSSYLLGFFFLKKLVYLLLSEINFGVCWINNTDND